MSGTCDRCSGPVGPAQACTCNRPGLSQLSYRVGTHATFLQSMRARLSSADPALEALRTRDADDPSIALLDAWATVGDVLTFYQERIANEGFLRTATERRSIVELAALIGYVPRPGVAATAHLAYSLDGNAKPLAIQPGTKVSSVPAPGEQMQTFETVEPLDARAEWNELELRKAQAQTKETVAAD